MRAVNRALLLRVRSAFPWFSGCIQEIGRRSSVIIDVHAHYYPSAYMELIGRPDVPSLLAAPLAQQGIGERLALMDSLGIDRQILSVSQAQPYLERRSDAATAARMANDLYDELCQRHPGRCLLYTSDAADEEDS